MNESTEWIELSRDCEAVLVPAGHTVLIPKGTRAVITQALGSSYTLSVPDYGGLVRISERDADAVGQERAETTEAPASSEDPLEGDELEQRIWTELRTCYDPEIPVDIYELGLIYKVEVRDANAIYLQMTLTSPMCPVAETLPPEVEHKVAGVSGVSGVELELVWEPPWNPDMMSEAARLTLNM